MATFPLSPSLSLKRIVPSRFQVPESNLRLVLHTAMGGPPVASILLSLPSAKKPMKRLSGDQKGEAAPSVPASGCAANEASERTQSSLRPSTFTTNASRRPSGETAIECQLSDRVMNSAFSGGESKNRTV